MSDKEYYKKLYIQLRNKLGKQPSSKVFYKEFNIDEKKLGKAFGSNAFSKLVSECGDTPNTFKKPKIPLEDILTQWGNLARELKKIPVNADWAYYNCKPTVDGIRKSYRLKWKDIPDKFLEYASDKPEWDDIVCIIPKRKYVKTEISNTITRKLTEEHYKYLPQIVHNLDELSISEERHYEFEKKVNLVFQMLGFEVDEYEQGTGRNPDGIVKDNPNRYAIIIDAKSRSNGYKLGTDDRQIIEYINKFKGKLDREGFHKIYFLIVSSRFETTSFNSINNIKLETNTITSLIPSNLLLKILAKKIELPRLFDLK